VPARQIQKGDLVFTAKGQWHKVQSIAALPEQQTVYNFEVEGNHDYFVGASGILVHNATLCEIARKAARGFENGECQQCAKAAAEEGTPITQEGLDAVESHLDSIDALDHPPNQAMLDNLRSLMGEGENATGPYENFYQHELKEAEGMSQGLRQETAHQMALEGLGHSPFSVYSPEVIEQFPEFFNSNWRVFWGLQ
jgi:hypothetical protein